MLVREPRAIVFRTTTMHTFDRKGYVHTADRVIPIVERETTSKKWLLSVFRKHRGAELIRHPDVPQHDAFVPLQLGRMYREGSAVTGRCPDVWVVGRRSISPGRKRAARFADMVASMLRRQVFRDSLDTFQGRLEFSRWVDRPGGVALRADMAQAQAWAESVLAVGIPKPTPITRPFSPSELQIDPDTLSFYIAKLPDTSFYSIGGCSDVEITHR